MMETYVLVIILDGNLRRMTINFLSGRCNPCKCFIGVETMELKTLK